jgi:hypothetical protein
MLVTTYRSNEGEAFKMVGALVSVYLLGLENI